MRHFVSKFDEITSTFAPPFGINIPPTGDAYEIYKTQNHHRVVRPRSL